MLVLDQQPRNAEVGDTDQAVGIATILSRAPDRVPPGLDLRCNSNGRTTGYD